MRHEINSSKEKLQSCMRNLSHKFFTNIEKNPANLMEIVYRSHRTLGSINLQQKLGIIPLF